MWEDLGCETSWKRIGDIQLWFAFVLKMSLRYTSNCKISFTFKYSPHGKTDVFYWFDRFLSRFFLRFIKHLGLKSVWGPCVSNLCCGNADIKTKARKIFFVIEWSLTCIRIYDPGSRFATTPPPPPMVWSQNLRFAAFCMKTWYLQCFLHGGWLARSANLQIRRISCNRPSENVLFAMFKLRHRGVVPFHPLLCQIIIYIYNSKSSNLQPR